MRFFLFLIAFLAMTPPAFAQEANGTIATENSEAQDAAIATRIREILAELENYDDVTVTVSEGVVTLRGTTTSNAEAVELEPLASRVEGVVAVRNQVVETTDISRRLDPAIDRFQGRIEQAIAYIPLLLIAGVVFAAVVMLGVMIARLREPWERLAPNAFIAQIYRQLIRLAFIVLGIVIALDILNATALLGTILGAAGIIGLALGFAVRDTVENFIASVMLSFRQPFRPNDTVEINGDQGKVIRLTSRATILLSFDGNHIRIPNSIVFKSRIVNFTENAQRRFLFPMTIARDADLYATRELIEKTVQDLPFVLDEPAGQTWIETLHTAGVDMHVTGWIDQNVTSFPRAKGEAIRQVKLALEAAGVEIPDATQVIALRRDRVPPPPTSTEESKAVVSVHAAEDEALERIVDAERMDDETEDLLHEGNPKE